MYGCVALDRESVAKTPCKRRYCTDICILDRRYVVDHINRDRLDCRNNNLRECTFAENSRNKSVYKNRSDGFTGVYHNGKKYIPTVRLNGELKKFGAYDTLEEAVDVRIKAANELFGEFSPYKS